METVSHCKCLLCPVKKLSIILMSFFLELLLLFFKGSTHLALVACMVAVVFKDENSHGTGERNSSVSFHVPLINNKVSPTLTHRGLTNYLLDFLFAYLVRWFSYISPETPSTWTVATNTLITQNWQSATRSTISSIQETINSSTQSTVSHSPVVSSESWCVLDY